MILPQFTCMIYLKLKIKQILFQEVFKMKHLKCKIALFMAVSFFCSNPATTAMAADYQTPASIVASLIGKTVTDVIQERFNTGKTYGTIAAEAGKLEEFKNEMLDNKEKILNDKVENNLISQEQADEILDTIKERQAVCDGTGFGQGNGTGNGSGRRNGVGRGQGSGFGNGVGRGQGAGLRNGTCIYYNN